MQELIFLYQNEKQLPFGVQATDQQLRGAIIKLHNDGKIKQDLNVRKISFNEEQPYYLEYF